MSDNFQNQSEEELIDVFWGPFPFVYLDHGHITAELGTAGRGGGGQASRRVALRAPVPGGHVCAQSFYILPTLWILEVDKRDKDKELKSAFPSLRDGATVPLLEPTSRLNTNLR